jgi:hypothetical protein
VLADVGGDLANRQHDVRQNQQGDSPQGDESQVEGLFEPVGQGPEGLGAQDDRGHQQQVGDHEDHQQDPAEHLPYVEQCGRTGDLGLSLH